MTLEADLDRQLCWAEDAVLAAHGFAECCLLGGRELQAALVARQPEPAKVRRTSGVACRGRMGYITIDARADCVGFLLYGQ